MNFDRYAASPATYTRYHACRDGPDRNRLGIRVPHDLRAGLRPRRARGTLAPAQVDPGARRGERGLDPGGRGLHAAGPSAPGRGSISSQPAGLRRADAVSARRDDLREHARGTRRLRRAPFAARPARVQPAGDLLDHRWAGFRHLADRRQSHDGPHPGRGRAGRRSRSTEVRRRRLHQRGCGGQCRRSVQPIRRHHHAHGLAARCRSLRAFLLAVRAFSGELVGVRRRSCRSRSARSGPTRRRMSSP